MDYLAIDQDTEGNPFALWESNDKAKRATAGIEASRRILQNKPSDQHSHWSKA